MSIREKLLDHMRNNGESSRGEFCTWWFKFRIGGHTTSEFRRELERMERDGLVTADREQTNNTKWRLTGAGQDPHQFR